MKKILTLVLALMLGVTCLAFTACNKTKKEYKITDAGDLITEDYGIIVKKGNTDLLEKINSTLSSLKNNGKLDEMVEYFTDLADPEKTVTDKKFEYDLTGTAGEITVYTESGFAPFEFVYNTKVVGVDIAIMSEVAKSLDMTLNVQDVLFDSIVTNVQNGNNFTVGAAGMTITDSRKESVDFSDIYFSTTLVILAEKTTTYEKISDLKNLKIGVQQGTTGDLVCSKAVTTNGYVYTTTNDDDEDIDVTVKVEGASVKQYNAYALALADLKNGKIDVIVMDKIPAQLLLANV